MAVLELLLGCLLALSALLVRQRYLRTRLSDILPVSFDRRVETHDGMEQFLARRAGASRELRPRLRPVGTAGKRSHAIVVEVDGVEVGRLARGDAGRYRARHGDAVTSCSGQVVRAPGRVAHELWLELHL